MQKIYAIAFGMLLAAASVHAAGPDNVARSNRSLWPDALKSTAGFDRASRAELLAFGHQLVAVEALSDDALRARLHLKEIDTTHLAKMRKDYWQRVARNYSWASAYCVASEPFCPAAKDVDSFKQASTAFAVPADERYRAWYDNAATFHRIYIDEILRLAALFPRISSEVDTFNADEFTGSDLPDRQFFLTFDDGPTAANGNTEKTLAVLRQAHLDATFFVLGSNLDARIHGAAIAPLYEGMCVGMHGWEHKSHSSWPQWQDSVVKTTALVHDQLPASFVPLFRPPYGQRKADSGTFFEEHNLQIALWNIDSQDWNTTVSGDEAGQRVLTLMLLWRHGIILFHDIHNKAQSAVPYLLAQIQGSDVTWAPCRSLTKVIQAIK
jgi:peptidoglycan-N-acetylglucosamine deacetylase